MYIKREICSTLKLQPSKFSGYYGVSYENIPEWILPKLAMVLQQDYVSGKHT